MHFTYYEIFNVFGVTLLVHNNIQELKSRTLHSQGQGCYMLLDVANYLVFTGTMFVYCLAVSMV